VDYVWATFLEKHRARFEARRTEPGTHALVLGVSAYCSEAKEFLELPDLDCAALAALRFARWLVDDYRTAADAPLASLRVLLSPSADERGEIPLDDLAGVERCKGEHVGKALHRWVRDCDAMPGNVGVLYGAGHGIRYQGDGPLLLLEDFWSTPSLANALDFPRSNLALDTLGLHTSLLFADCCQQIDDDLERLKVPGPIFAPTDTGLSQRRESWGLYRGATGGGSAYGVARGTTHFVEALIEGLESRSATHDEDGLWMVTTDSLKTTLAGLVSEREVDQGPRCTSEGPVPGRFHLLPVAPTAKLSVFVSPEDHAAATTGSIDQEGVALGAFAFEEHPYVRSVESGPYRVKVAAEPPLPFIQPTRDVTVWPYNGGRVTFKVRQ